MIILLLALLAFAICITLAGLWLSPKKSVPPQRSVSYAGQMNVRRPMRRNHTVGENRRMSVRRSSVEVERRAWADILTSLNISRLFAQQRRRRDTPWLGITLILLALFLFGVYFLRTALPSPTLFALLPDNSTTTGTSNANNNGSNTSGKQPFTGASKALVRLSQVDPAQYNSMQEFNTWWPSACSAASMTVIINSYGHHYRVTDILKVETSINEITANDGLLEPHGLDKTLAKFNFTTHWLYDPSALPANPSIDYLVNTANSGTPVIINFPPSRWAGGHILVALGGNKDYVYLADSSRLNMRAMDRKTFLKYWIGFAAVATPA